MSGTGYSPEEGHQALKKLENGTIVRHAFVRGELSGKVIEAKIEDGHIVYDDQKYSPTGAARAALQDIHDDPYEENGWHWWEYCDENGNWVKLKEVR